MKIYLIALVLFVAAFAAGCGGGGSGSSTTGNASLSTDDVVVVGGQHVTKSTFDDIMHQEDLSIKAQGAAVPKPGSANYTSVRNQVIALLVQNAEFDEQAAKLGVAPTAKDVNDELTKLKKQYFGGSQAKYLASLKKQGYTDAEVRDQIKIQLTSQNLFKKVAGKIKASPAQVQSYYQAHLDQYVSQSRQVEEILVGKNKQSLANQIYNQVKGGASFAALAKKYSQDPGSKNIGGKFTAKKGSDVSNFDAAVFSPNAATGVLLKPVNTPEYGWFVIKPLADIKTTTTTEKQAASAIKTTLNQTAQNNAMNKWVTGIARTYCKAGIKYQAGYQPNPDPCTTLTTSAPTTT
jgi:parvulin-like peptidyl-prolyl isomerase